MKVNPQVYQQVPSGWIYDSTTSFELECDCPTLSLTSGAPIQELCDGDAMQSLVYDFGGTGTTINVGTMPSGLQSSISSGTLTISGTPVFTNNDYSFSVFTTDGNANCSQVSQTITLSKKDSPLLTLISGSYNQTITLGDYMQPIVFSFGGSTTSVTITGPEPQDISQSGNTITISGDFDETGTNTGTITTISSGGCTEITQSIAVTVNAPVVTNTGGTSTGGTTYGGTTTGGTTTTSTNSGGTTVSCIQETSNNLQTFKFSIGDTNLKIDDLTLRFVANSGSTLSGIMKGSQLTSELCGNNNATLYTLDGPFIWQSGWDGSFKVGQAYTIQQVSTQIESNYISSGFGGCENPGVSCNTLGIGRVDIYINNNTGLTFAVSLN